MPNQRCAFGTPARLPGLPSLITPVGRLPGEAQPEGRVPDAAGTENLENRFTADWDSQLVELSLKEQLWIGTCTGLHDGIKLDGKFGMR